MVWPAARGETRHPESFQRVRGEPRECWRASRQRERGVEYIRTTMPNGGAGRGRKGGLPWKYFGDIFSARGSARSAGAKSRKPGVRRARVCRREGVRARAEERRRHQKPDERFARLRAAAGALREEHARDARAVSGWAERRKTSCL